MLALVVPRHIVAPAPVVAPGERARARLGADVGALGDVPVAGLEVALEVAHLGELVLRLALGAADGAHEGLLVHALMLLELTFFSERLGAAVGCAVVRVGVGGVGLRGGPGGRGGGQGRGVGGAGERGRVEGAEVHHGV